MWADSQYQPVQLPGIISPLHGGETGFDSRTDEDLNDVPNRLFHDKVEKYKGIQFRDNLSIAVFQSFKSEWKAYVLSTRLPKAQQTRQLLSRGLAGKAIVVVSQRFGEEIGDIEADTILNFLEEKVCAHLGVLGKMDLMKKVKRRPAKWRDNSNLVNSIFDIEILKVKGRLNDLIDEQILVDTGARSNVVSRETIRKLNLLHQIVPTEIRLSTANNSSLQVLGKIELVVKWQKELAMESTFFNYAAYQDELDSINSCL
ncbi:MAG TPA: retropepsin-like aspartic protease, partial [Candidatus Limnocylindrales bacterium]|nr:retropepsin-like aspartic protease [Candidatus Limnocylindrales bacterium]